MRILGWMQPVTIYESVSEPTPQTTIADVLVGAVLVVLGLAAVALVLGAVFAGVLIGVRRLRRARQPVGSESGVTRLDLDTGVPSPPPSKVPKPKESEVVRGGDAVR